MMQLDQFIKTISQHVTKRKSQWFLKVFKVEGKEVRLEAYGTNKPVLMIEDTTFRSDADMSRNQFLNWLRNQFDKEVENVRT